MTSPSDYSDDPRLTAYVLGELDTAEAAELAREIETNPDMQAAVDELRELIGDVTTALETEATPQLAAEQRASLETASVALAGPDGSRRAAVADAGRCHRPTGSPGFIRYPGTQFEKTSRRGYDDRPWIRRS